MRNLCCLAWSGTSKLLRQYSLYQQPGSSYNSVQSDALVVDFGHKPIASNVTNVLYVSNNSRQRKYFGVFPVLELIIVTYRPMYDDMTSVILALVLFIINGQADGLVFFSAKP